MSDITKCNGANCHVKESCKRFTAESGYRQSWFTESPMKNGKCEMYWGVNQENILNQLKNIIGICLISLFLVSCGSVKKTQEETIDKTETTTDLTKLSSSLTLEPVNLDRPILVTGSNGKTDTIYNTRVIYNNSKETIKEVEKKDIRQEVSTKEKDYSEVIEKLANRFIWLIGMLFVISIIAKKINPLS